MQKNLLIVSFSLLIVMTTSCHQTSQKEISKVLEENPGIILKALEKEPAKLVALLESSVQKSRQEQIAKQQKQEKEEIRKYLEKPLEPELSSNTFEGKEDAPITIVGYSDFQCPYCSKGHKTLQTLKEKYKGKIKVVYKHLPLDFHPQAMIAAKYFEAISLQSKDKAISFQNEIFKDQGQLRKGENYLRKIANKLKIDLKQLEIDIKSKAVISKIQDDIDEAQKFEIRGTPGFIVNGVPVRGAYPASHFEEIISQVLKKKEV